MAGVNGGWALLYGGNSLTSTALRLAIDEDQIYDTERAHISEQVAYIVFGSADQTSDNPHLRQGVVTGVGNSWKTVTLDHSYNSMVVVASPNYDAADPPLVVRIKNASGNNFDVRVDRADNSSAAVSGIDVHYMVVERGTYNAAQHGVKMEADKFNSAITDENGSWVGQSRSYDNAYTNPVVLGQVMTYNDPDWSTFWARGSSAGDPPSSSTLYAGKMVGEDSDTTRADETIGYIVIEAGQGTLSGSDYVAGLGTKSVAGIDNSPPYAYGLSGLGSADTAVVSQSGMAGVNGSWAVLYGTGPLSAARINLAVDEDQIHDTERGPYLRTSCLHCLWQLASPATATPTPTPLPSCTPASGVLANPSFEAGTANWGFYIMAAAISLPQDLPIIVTMLPG